MEPEVTQGIMELYGLDPATLAAVIPFGIAITAMIKKITKLSGAWLYAVTGGLALLLNAVAPEVTFKTFIISSIVSFVGMAGGYQTMKELFKKANTQ